MGRFAIRVTALAVMAPLWCGVAGCGDPPADPESIAPPPHPISEASKAAAQEPRFEEYRRILRAQFAALKKAGEFYRKATSSGSHPMTASDLEQHNALRGESDALAEECFKYADAHFPDESPEVLQQIYNEELAKAMPDG